MSDDRDDQDALGDDWEAALSEQREQSPKPDETDDVGAGSDDGDEAIAAAELENLQADKHPETGTAGAAGASGEDVNLDVILDIPVTLSMEIGRTRITVRNLLQLNQGSVVELDRLAGEPLDVMVNGTLIAHGEVVVVNERFGIRLTDVISPSERVQKLK